MSTRAQRGAAQRAAGSLLLGLALGLAAPPASAHLASAAPTLRQLVAGSDLVASVLIDSAPATPAGLADALLQRPVVEARVLQPVKGRAEPDQLLRFAQHGEGRAEFGPGEQVLLFLQRIERSPELARSGLAGSLRWVSLQEHDAKYTLEGQTGEAVVAAARRYAALGTLPDPGAQRDGLRRATLELLASPDPRLATSALRDLGLAEEFPLIERSDLPGLEALLANASRPAALRAGLLVELERRRLLDGAEHWLRLLRSTAGSERVALVRAAGAHPQPPVRAELARLLSAGEPGVAAAAALALGQPGADQAVPSLAAALRHPDVRVRWGALRGLQRIGTPAAHGALEEVARSRADPDTRRRARAAALAIAPRS